MRYHNLPENPGCYIFKDAEDEVLYIGKAKNIRKRVNSYFHSKDHTVKTELMLEDADDVDFIITDSEPEALILESNLIKKHQPKYNIQLKDNKRYAYIKLTDEPFPRLVISRKKSRKGKYFGPFVSAQTRDYVLSVLQKTFKIRTCKTLPKRACLRYHIDLCTAPCIGKVDEQQYEQQTRRAEMVLKGNTDRMIAELEQEMYKASEQQNFEYALELKNQIQALSWLNEKQKMERVKHYDEDIINYMIKEDRVYLMLFNVHKGILENKQEFEFPLVPQVLEQFISQYYQEEKVPKELILPEEIDRLVHDLLSVKRGNKVRVRVPKRGEKKKLLRLVRKNIQVSFFGDVEVLKQLRKQLRMQTLPRVIECFDISHLSGTSTAASMVQFRNAKPDKSNYRRYRIRTVEGADDVKSMKEVVHRRYRRLVEEKRDLPDLVMIDGGKGQLRAAYEELDELGIKIPIIAIAKRFEEI